MTREEATKIIKEFISGTCLHLVDQEALETLIPELKESEDERVRKEIIEFIQWSIDRHFMREDYHQAKRPSEWIAYLEKQKEQKPANNNKSEMSDENGHLTGKILVEYGAHAKVRDGKRHCEMEWKEFQRLAHYFYELGKAEQKPAEWSVEDKSFYDSIMCEVIKEGMHPTPEQANWFKLLPERFNLLSKQEWSEEDEEMRNLAIEWAETMSGQFSFVDMDPTDFHKITTWLKSLRPQPKKELSIEKAIQWLDDTFYFLDNSSGRGRDCEITTHDFDSLEEMYDSFRKAVIVDSEPHWKPSEEQMDVLNKMTLGNFLGSGQYDILRTLYEDLKKLM